MSTKIKDVIIWGATGQARVLNEYLTSNGYRLIALFDNNEKISSPFSDVPLFYGKEGFDQWSEARDANSPCAFLVAIGGKHGKDRLELHEWLEGTGLTPMTVGHPTAFIAANAYLGSGSQVLAQSSVCAEATLGRCCIINTAASVDHECRLGDAIHIGPGAHLAGCINVGSFAMIGTGATVAPRLSIGEGAIVGAGAVVIRDVAPYTVVAGNPAHVIQGK